MFIEYLGHSCFYLKGKEFSVVTDPFSGIGYPLKRVSCDYVISSHGHFDHNNFEGVDARFRVTKSTPVFKGIECYHDEVHGRKRGRNTAFYFKLDGLNILHLGDLGEPFGRLAEKFRLPVDVLFIPVGGVYTIDAQEAVKYARFIGAKVTVIMHYATKNSTVGVAPSEVYYGVCGGFEEVDNGLEITRDNIDTIPSTIKFKFE